MFIMNTVNNEYIVEYEYNVYVTINNIYSTPVPRKALEQAKHRRGVC